MYMIWCSHIFPKSELRLNTKHNIIDNLTVTISRSSGLGVGTVYKKHTN